MKLNNIKKQAGLTLIEVTLVIAVLLGLISVLFIGVTAYKEGSNRAKCILNIATVQKAVRSFQNLYELNMGAPLLTADIAGAGKMIETVPECPTGGAAAYTFLTVVPTAGTAYLECDVDGHAPVNTNGW